ncbi:outer membrane beta-barrel protein [Kaarinaea lacus]
MNYKIKIIIISVLLLITSNVFAAKYGIGMSARSGETEVYLPIDIASQFRLEPSIRYSHSKENSSIDSIDSTENTNKTYTLSLGVFYQFHAHDAINIYSGIRAGYFKSESTSTSSSGGIIYDSSFDGDGYSVVPTLGVGYLFARSFSITGEVGYAFIEADYENTGGNFGTRKMDTETQATVTRLILRYFF